MRRAKIILKIWSPKRFWSPKITFWSPKIRFWSPKWSPKLDFGHQSGFGHQSYFWSPFWSPNLIGISVLVTILVRVFLSFGNHFGHQNQFFGHQKYCLGHQKSGFGNQNLIFGHQKSLFDIWSPKTCIGGRKQIAHHARRSTPRARNAGKTKTWCYSAPRNSGAETVPKR